ncbi:MAG: helix-hairpin-helix domain-containing protein [Lachnospiraceae bacterium]|nr:helix-hairpin-helix domain-containing protein [Lachnospiraceae bacterium]
MKKEYRKALIGAVLFVLLGLMFLIKLKGRSSGADPETDFMADDRLSVSERDEDSEDSASEPETEESLLVYVSGAVRNPGVYRLPLGSRVYEALDAAGGLTQEAEEGLINLAEPLTDGEMIYFPKKGEDSSGQVQLSDGKVDLNRAGKEELMTLPGIGETKAEAILQYRKEHGPFQTIEELMQVSGIGEALFEKIKNRVKI